MTRRRTPSAGRGRAVPPGDRSGPGSGARRAALPHRLTAGGPFGSVSPAAGGEEGIAPRTGPRRPGRNGVRRPGYGAQRGSPQAAGKNFFKKLVTNVNGLCIIEKKFELRPAVAGPTRSEPEDSIWIFSKGTERTTASRQRPESRTLSNPGSERTHHTGRKESRESNKTSRR